LSGGLALLKNITQFFEQKFGIRAERFNPFRNVWFDEKKLDPVYPQEMAPSSAWPSGSPPGKWKDNMIRINLLKPESKEFGRTRCPEKEFRAKKPFPLGTFFRSLSSSFWPGPSFSRKG
jgi:hypothetical protein